MWGERLGYIQGVRDPSLTVLSLSDIESEHTNPTLDAAIVQVTKRVPT